MKRDELLMEKMPIPRGTKLLIHDRRNGTYRGVACRDFDAIHDEYYPVVTLEPVRGSATIWEIGEEIPCFRNLAQIEVIE